MAVDAVIFDWGGTLTPWHNIDFRELWRSICAAQIEPERLEEIIDALLAAEDELWRRSREEHRSGTLAELLERAGVASTGELMTAMWRAWEPHTITAPDASGLLRALRERDIRVGVLSNTLWSREWHDRVFVRDLVHDLIDGAVYSSEIPWTKPAREAFRSVMAAVGVDDPAACVFVGDRPFEDIHGAKAAGMRAVLLPNTAVPSYDAVRPDAVIGCLADLLPLVDSWQ